MNLARFGAMLIGIALLAVIVVLYPPQITPENEKLFIIIGMIGAVSGAIMVSIKQIRDAIYLTFYSRVHYGWKHSNQSWRDLEVDLIIQTIGLSLTALSAVFLGIIALR